MLARTNTRKPTKRNTLCAARGIYCARSLSWSGTEYRVISCENTAAGHQLYDSCVKLWNDIMQWVQHSQRCLGIKTNLRCVAIPHYIRPPIFELYDYAFHVWIQNWKTVCRS